MVAGSAAFVEEVSHTGLSHASLKAPCVPSVSHLCSTDHKNKFKSHLKNNLNAFLSVILFTFFLGVHF